MYRSALPVGLRAQMTGTLTWGSYEVKPDVIVLFVYDLKKAS
jgi:hypothetical protein